MGCLYAGLQTDFNFKATHCLKQQIQMTPVSEPLLPHPLPECLYSIGEKHLILPGTLLNAYKSQLIALGINPDVQPVEKRTGPIGGKGKKATNEHFLEAFNGSCARVQLAVINPNKKESFISDVFIEAMCGGSVAFIDIPCGCGASFISVLTVIAELRRERVLPRQPLKIRLVAGDISPSALGIAERMLNEIRPFIEGQAMTVTVSFCPWDVTDRLSTTDLVKRALKQADGVDRTFVLIANFSGFLSLPGKQGESHKQIAEIFKYLSGEESMGVWIEPQTNNAGSIFSWATKNIFEPLKKIFTGENSIAAAPISRQLIDDCLCSHFNQSESRFPVRLTAEAIEIKR